MIGPTQPKYQQETGEKDIGVVNTQTVCFTCARLNSACTTSGRDNDATFFERKRDEEMYRFSPTPQLDSKIDHIDARRWNNRRNEGWLERVAKKDK